jgi:hypothetical protein
VPQEAFAFMDENVPDEVSPEDLAG